MILIMIYFCSLQESGAEDEDAVVLKKAQGILNKLSRKNFERLSRQLLEVGLTNETRIQGVTRLVFAKALDEEFLGSIYADLCKQLMDLAKSEAGKEGFRRDLLNQVPPE